MFAEFLNLIFWFSALILFSFLLDRLWSYSLWRWVYIVFAAPGIVVHELSHYAACKVTFTEVRSVRLISGTGGSVTHGPPKGGVFGQVFISMAPFIGIPLILILLAMLFDWVAFFNCDLRMAPDLSGNVGEMILGTLESALDLIKTNFWDNGSPWFLLYLYIAASLTTALAPSKQDFVNAMLGLVALIVIIGGWALVLDLLLDSWKAPVANFLVDLFGWVIAVGLIMCLFGLIVGLPFFLLKKVGQWDEERQKMKKKEKQRKKKQKTSDKKDKDKEKKEERKKQKELDKQRKKLEYLEKEVEKYGKSDDP